MQNLKIFENPKVIDAVKTASIIILFSSFVLQFISVVVWDVDFWWHIATGRQIISSGALPETDPFSFTTVLEENKNPFPEWERFILKQYWLGQIILYPIFDYFGPEGIVIFRALMLISTLGIAFWLLKRWTVSFPVSFIAIFVVFLSFLKFTGERPVLFTILFTALTFFLLEDFSRNRKKRILLLIPLMLLWSNLHGGYIIGAIIIFLFTTGEIADLFLKKAVYNKQEMYQLIAVSLFSVLATSINPSGWQAVLISFNIPFKYKAIHENIMEYFSPVYLYWNKLYPVDYGYVSLVVLSPVILFLRNKKIRISHLLILTAFWLMSLSALRMVVYFVILGSLILARETDLLAKGFTVKRLTGKSLKYWSAVLIAACFFSAALYFSGKIHDSGFMVADAVAAPTKAADFIEAKRLSGNMFNDYGYGGYLTWRLYPGQKTFIDSRALNINIRKEYAWIINAEEVDSKGVDGVMTRRQLWEMLLKHYHINFILLKVSDPLYQIHPLIFKLADSDQWAPVYCDNESVIFLRNNELNKKTIEAHELPVEEIFNTIIYQSARNALRNKTSPISLISLGDIFYRMSRLEEARRSYAYALERMPENPVIQEKIRQVRSEIEQGNKSR